MACQRTVLIAGALGLAALASPASAGTRTTADVLYSENPQERAFQESAGYSDAVILRDGTIYLSGVVVGPTADKAAFERVYRRISDILLRAGATWEDVVDITSFHTDIEPQVAVHHPALCRLDRRAGQPALFARRRDRDQAHREEAGSLNSNLSSRLRCNDR
jgi:enamine deaminase RidA (YjgF/YER057c/UK114 family)